MPKKADPHIRKKTHSLPEDAVKMLYDFFEEWEQELKCVNVETMPDLIKFLTKNGVPAAKRILVMVRTEQSDITHNQTIQRHQP